MIKAAIFDVGGVLHSDEGEHIRRDITSTLGVSEEQYHVACKLLIPSFHTGKTNETAFWEGFVRITKAARPVPRKSLWAREFRKRYKLQGEVIEIVHALKEKRVKVAVLSNTIEPHVRVNRKMGVYDPFHEVILSCEVGLAKPDPDIYQLALRRLQVQPEHTVFVDDKAENVEAAAQLGIKGIVFQHSSQLKTELRRLGVTLS